MENSTNSRSVDHELKINLAALRKCDEFVLDILETSSQVAVYKFDAVKSEWEKTDVEGSFFLYRRSTLPKFSVMIMNRLNRENLNVHISKEMEIKVQKPFLLYKNSSTGIQGIWFNDPEKCGKIGELVAKLYTSPKLPQQEPKSVIAEPVRETPVRETPVRETPSNVEFERNGGGDKNILSMFAEAQRKYDENKLQTINGVRILQDTPDKPMLNVKARSKSLSIQQPAPTYNQTISAVENEDREVIAETLDDPCVIKSSPLRPPASALSKSLPNSSKKNTQRQLFTQEPLAQYLNQLPTEKIPFPSITAQSMSAMKTINTKPVLSSQRSGSDITLAASLMSPLAFKSAKLSTSNNQPETPVLTKEQLQETLMYLLQKDSAFLEKIHSAYLKTTTR